MQSKRQRIVAWTCLVIASLLNVHSPAEAQSRRTSGLIALYEFTEASGNVIKDRSGFGKALDL